MRLSWCVASAAIYLAGCGLILEGDPPIGGTPSDSAIGMDGAGDAVIPDAGTPDGVLPDECADRGDFEDCNPGAPEDERWVCIGETCRQSVCGDGFVDDESEDCDDGNVVPGDGCEPDCSYTCEEDGDCDDDEECNGLESCDSHACVTGAPLPDGQACMIADGNGVCRTGFCAPLTCGDGALDPGEQCDDGDDVVGDGCDPDCTFSCETNVDCLGNVCEAGVCDTASHRCDLVERDTDADGYTIGGACGGPDCDDRDGAVNPGVAVDRCNMIDDDCDGAIDEDDPPVACWTDADGDSHSDLPLVFFCRETCPTGFVPRPISDCYDSATDPVAADVRPGQPSYFDVPYMPRAGVMSFDYDCDGAEVPLYPVLADCGPSMGVTECAMGSGFLEPVPACGDPGTWVTCAGVAGSCGLSMTTRVQPCR